MTLDEAIKHCEEVAQEKRYEYQECLVVHDMENAMVCGKCGEEHEQLAEWLKELKKFREQEPCEDAINRQAVLEWIKGSLEQYANTYSNDMLNMWKLFEEQIKALPPIQPKVKVGKWIRWYEQLVNDGCVTHKPHCKCSECNMEYDSYSTRFMNYCPNCGSEMRED